MTRILHILASADPRDGGPVEGALRAGEMWSRQGHQQELMTLDAPDASFLADVPAVVHALGKPRNRTPWSRYRYAPGVVEWIKANAPRYDAVIVAGLWNYSSMAARLALAGGPTPYFVFTHGMLDPWFRKTYPLKGWLKQLFWLGSEGPLLRHARGVLFTTEEERMLADKAFWPYRANARVVGYGTADVSGNSTAQIAAFRHAVPALGERRYLLFLSRVHPKKGCDLLIDAFASIADRASDLDLVIAGPDHEGLVDRLKAQVGDLHLEDRVHFPEMLQGDQKWGAFRGCEAFVLTSHQENFGVVVAEALACAKPVLISDKVNIWREVAADKAGLVEPDTHEGSCRLLARFLGLECSERKRMGERARESFLARFTIEAAAANLMTQIECDISR
ncbi:glycosyltransferase [Hephaestia sp. GCM10023244]|uniref:glycosyltransferase n=1 Tax=unclassified Hephaestia TaxID=2631281 RepID=UPI0020779BD2|nr:glycosyltransferase [Hephaestia sp. MAHUQ-44]MCM8732550.1 glycosyltransferase [Hephaestia sp. MAHUQ-44]